MRIEKILGSVVQGHISHSIAKLENGCYAVGHLTHGQTVRADDQFKTLDTAFEHWVSTLIIGGDSLRVNTGHVLSGHKQGQKHAC